MQIVLEVDNLQRRKSVCNFTENKITN